MRILGVDPALRCTGYGLIEANKNKFSLIEAGVIKTTSSQAIEKRLDDIYSSVQKLIKETKPDCLVLEKLYAHWRHPTTAYVLGHSRGVVCLACSELQIPLIEYAVTRIKKAIVGNGNASKVQVQRMVQSFLGLSEISKQTDVSDALALAIAHGFILKNKL